MSVLIGLPSLSFAVTYASHSSDRSASSGISAAFHTTSRNSHFCSGGGAMSNIGDAAACSGVSTSTHISSWPCGCFDSGA